MLPVGPPNLILGISTSMTESKLKLDDFKPLI